MRAGLSERQAAACEHATTPASKCRCRCGGKFHGSKRVGATGRELEQLPADDPHKLPPKVQPDLDLGAFRWLPGLSP